MICLLPSTNERPQYYFFHKIVFPFLTNSAYKHLPKINKQSLISQFALTAYIWLIIVQNSHPQYHKLIMNIFITKKRMFWMACVMFWSGKTEKDQSF